MIDALGNTLSNLSDFHPAIQLLLIALSVSFSEEIAALAVFGLARHGDVAWWVGIAGVFSGAWSAQALIWLAGRVSGHRALSWRIFRGLRESGKLESIHHHVVREGWIAVAVMRFVPGTRIPVCLGAGILGMGAVEFLGVLTIATAAWIGATMAFAQSFVDAIGGNPLSLLLGLALVVPLAFAARFWIRRRRSRASVPPV